MFPLCQLAAAGEEQSVTLPAEYLKGFLSCMEKEIDSRITAAWIGVVQLLHPRLKLFFLGRELCMLKERIM